MTEQSLVLANVAVRRGRSAIVKDISARLSPGQLVGVIGPNGAGKSTLLAAIAGHLAYSGGIRWKGAAVNPAALGYMPQASRTRAALSVLETVLLGGHERLGWRVRDADLAPAEAVLATLGLGDLANRAINTLSGGQQQLVMLAQRLVRRPDLLILDEPTSALDLRHQMAVLEHLKGYLRDSGALVLIAIHDLNLAARYADSLLMLGEGRLVACGPCSNVLSAEVLRETYGIEVEMLRSADGQPIIVPLAAVS